MRVFGVDFTSRPTRAKPITCAQCQLVSDRLQIQSVVGFTGFDEFEDWLKQSGPWIAGMDFPFGQSQRFVQNIGWPSVWVDYVRHVSLMTRQEFRQALDDYRAPRPPGDKEHQRSGDKATGAISPQKLYGVPVGLMFFEGAQRLLASGVHIPGLVEGDMTRQVIEAYPGVLARRVSRDSYKSDTKSKQSQNHRNARDRILRYVQSSECYRVYGINVELDNGLEDDPSGDVLDAVLCALQAAWAWRNQDTVAAALTEVHRLEGWIADPLALGLE